MTFAKNSGVIMLGALSFALLAGCSPQPAPTPTPTAAFASEEEAFAAAEETYRAYNDALNAVDATNPETFEPVFEFSSGSFAASDRENLSTLYAEGRQILGDAQVLQFEGVEAKPPYDTVTASICLDVSAVDVVDESGNSLVNPNRPDVYALHVLFQRDGAKLLIDSSDTTDDTSCAGL